MNNFIRVTLGVLGLTFNTLGFCTVAVMDVVLSNCKDSHGSYRGCRLDPQSMAIPNMSLSDMQLSKQVTLYWKAARCPRQLKWQARLSTGAVLELPAGQERALLIQEISETNQAVSIELSDLNTEMTQRAFFHPECHPRMVIESQTYTQLSLEAKKDVLMVDLREVGDQISSNSHVIDILSKSDPELQRELDGIKDTLNTLRATINRLKQNPENKVQEEALRGAEAKLQGEEKEYERVKSLDQNTRNREKQPHETQLAEAKQRRGVIQGQAERLLNHLSSPDLEAALAESYRSNP